jgi:hypothetical protein
MPMLDKRASDRDERAPDAPAACAFEAFPAISRGSGRRGPQQV